MTIISDNIRYLRKERGYTQAQFAEKMDIKRSLVGAYEEGRADPRLNNLIKIAEVFSVEVDTLIRKDIAKLSISEATKEKLKILAITVDKQNNENIELVPQKAAAGYLNGYADTAYIQELPRFQLPNLPKSATYRAFEISGDSMLPLQSGTIVIGSYVEKITDIKNGKTYVLVTSKEGVVYKRVFNYLEEKNKLALVSDNIAYSPYNIEPTDVLEIWEAKAFISVSFPDPKQSNDISLDKLSVILKDLQEELVKLKG